MPGRLGSGGEWFPEGGFAMLFKVGTVFFDRNGSSGNIFAIMGGATRILRHLGMDDRAKEMVSRVESSGSYDEALEIIGEYVRLEEREEGWL